MPRHLVETRIKKLLVHHGKAIDFHVDLVRLPNGARARREYTAHPGAVAVVPFLNKDTVIMVRQYRYPIGKITYEIPAGKLARGENPLSCIRRELGEETGYRAGRLRRVLSYWPAAAFSNELLHVYVAEQLKPGPAHPDEDEFLEAVHVPFRKALAWVSSGKIKDSKTIIGILACALPLPRRLQSQR